MNNVLVQVVNLSLCTVLLVDDKRYPWLVLVPRKVAAVEIIDLSTAAQRQVWEEVAQVSRMIQQLPGVEKLNVATLGNVCSQLHIHVTGRRRSDDAWPQPCYGIGESQPYNEEDLHQFLDLLRHELTAK